MIFFKFIALYKKLIDEKRDIYWRAIGFTWQMVNIINLIDNKDAFNLIGF